MSSNNYDKQKSLKRRFLFLGVIRLVLMTGAGLAVIFWHKINLDVSPVTRIVIGLIFIIIGVLRFIFSNKNHADGQI